MPQAGDARRAGRGPCFLHAEHGFVYLVPSAPGTAGPWTQEFLTVDKHAVSPASPTPFEGPRGGVEAAVGVRGQCLLGGHGRDVVDGGRLGRRGGAAYGCICAKRSKRNETRRTPLRQSRRCGLGTPRSGPGSVSVGSWSAARSGCFLESVSRPGKQTLLCFPELCPFLPKHLHVFVYNHLNYLTVPAGLKRV